MMTTLVPYAEILASDSRSQLVKCPVCGELFRETQRKDFESFRNVKYAAHVADKHPEKVVRL
jgi:uncharacterized C2H2 Zn-finger protein